MVGEYLFEKVNETELMNESLASIFRGSEVSSSASSADFTSFGDGVLGDGFYMGSLVTKCLNELEINDLNSCALSMPKKGAFNVKCSKKAERCISGKSGVFVFSPQKVRYDSATACVNDYAIIIDKNKLISKIETRYKLPYVQKEIIALDLRKEKVQQCFQFVESTLNILRAFPSTRNSMLVKKNLEQIASFMLIEIIAESLEARSLLNQSADKQLVVTAEEMMEAEYKNLFSIQEIADRLFTSPRNLQRAFKKQRDYTPLQFLQSRKISEANKILLDNQNPFLTIKEVALHVGILDLNRFGKYYFKHFGEYPKDTLKR